MNKEMREALEKLATGMEAIIEAVGETESEPEAKKDEGYSFCGESAHGASLSSIGKDGPIFIVLRGRKKNLLWEIESADKAREWIEAFEAVEETLKQREEHGKS